MNKNCSAPINKFTKFSRRRENLGVLFSLYSAPPPMNGKFTVCGTQWHTVCHYVPFSPRAGAFTVSDMMSHCPTRNNFSGKLCSLFRKYNVIQGPEQIVLNNSFRGYRIILFVDFMPHYLRNGRFVQPPNNS